MEVVAVSSAYVAPSTTVGSRFSSRFSGRPSHGYCPAEVPPFAEVVDICISYCTTVVTHIPGLYVVVSRDVVSSDIIQ